MLTRRIATAVCALCVAAPAAAGASPAQGSPIRAPGDAVTSAAKAKGPYGTAPATDRRNATMAKGPYGIAPATDRQNATMAKGPYGIAPAHATVASSGDSTNDWRTAALTEAALLAALALGSALLLQPRRTAPRVGT